MYCANRCPWIQGSIAKGQKFDPDYLVAGERMHDNVVAEPSRARGGFSVRQADLPSRTTNRRRYVALLEPLPVDRKRFFGYLVCAESSEAA
ncbi:MAG: hypothetical protein GIX02_09880 [Candidatus Eremiobacteraeota bacterium]|nr:hypothetical protein [Candidatus Eremiobacteraeota bacterium]